MFLLSSVHVANDTMLLFDLFDGFHLIFYILFASTNARAETSSERRTQHSDAPNAIRNPQRRAHCRATKAVAIRMQRRQHAAHSGVRAAERRNFLSSDAPNAMRNPQRRTHYGATRLLDPWLPLDGTFVVLVILVKYVVVLVLFVNYVICHSVTLCYMSCCYPRK